MDQPVRDALIRTQVPCAAWKLFLATAGPGLVVMFADTDVGSIITAAQSGTQWGYRLVLLQALLVPVLFVVQELTVRLGVFTGKGHGELIREQFGPGWAWLSVSGLWVATLGALLTEFSGAAGVGELFGIPRAVSLAASAAFLLLVVLTGSYRRVERVAIGLGLFELAFFLVAYAAHPRAADVAAELAHMPLRDGRFLYLVAANIGAVIMPWMIFYQQSAVAEKRLEPKHYRAARWDTALGALITQAIMAAVLLSAAATIGRRASGASLDSIGEVTAVLAAVMGPDIGRVVFGIGTLGAAMVAAIVVSLAAAWGFGEVTGHRHSLEHHPFEAPWFYGIYCVAIIAGALIVGLTSNLVELNLGVEVMNALLLPVVLGFLVLLALRALPAEHRPGRAYGVVVVVVSLLTAGLGVYGGLAGTHLF